MLSGNRFYLTPLLLALPYRLVTCPDKIIFSSILLQAHPFYLTMSSYPSSTYANNGSVKRFISSYLPTLSYHVHFRISLPGFPLSRTYRSSPLTELSSISPSYESSTPKAGATESDHGTSHILSSSSAAGDQQNLSASRITNYLEDPTTSHVEPRHISPRDSARIHTVSDNK